MRIYVIIPVFNRLMHTKAVLEALNRQTLRQFLKIVIVDDGSSDGTAEFLAKQKGVTVLKGGGSLWWAGATQLGLDCARASWGAGDFILFLNNDLIFDQNFVETLLQQAEQNPGAVIGSALYDLESKNTLLRLGPKINLAKRQIYDLAVKLSQKEIQEPKATYEVDALGGRGTLYRVEFFERYGMLRPKLLPHYFADYEISMRFKKNGIGLIVPTNSRVYSQPVYGYKASELSFFATFFTNKSQRNLIHGMVFYFLISSGANKVVMPLLSLYWGLKDAYLRLIRGAYS